MAEENERQLRYEALADFVSGLVELGTLQAGMRAPSLRSLAQQHGTSISTAQQAYRLLEDRGVLEARPKSGFYIRPGSAVGLERPALSQPPQDASLIAIGGVLDLLEQGASPDLAPLGCAVPDAKLLAAGRLDRFLARAARNKGTQYNSYLEPRGLLDLRQQIARRALRWGQALAPEDLAITYGCTEALSLALSAVTRPGDTVAIESPTYFGLLQTLESKGLKALELPTHATDGLDLNALSSALERHPVRACLFSSSFNNPLGCLMPDAKKRALVRILAEHDVPLIEDDIYGDIYFGETRPKPFLALAPDADILYCSSFSKVLAPGYRVGWLATKRHLTRVLEAKFANTLCGAVLPQAALADFLSSGGYDNHLRRMRRVFAQNIDRMTRAVARHFPASTKITRPSGGFVLWLELPPQFDSRAVYALALKEGVCFAPGDVFSASDRYRHCLRLSCGHTWDASLEAAVATLGRLVEEAIAD